VQLSGKLLNLLKLKQGKKTQTHTHMHTRTGTTGRMGNLRKCNRNSINFLDLRLLITGAAFKNAALMASARYSH